MKRDAVQRPGRLKVPILPGNVTSLRRIIDHAAIGMALLAKDGRLLYANRAFQSLIGHTARQCAGLGVADITHPLEQRKLKPTARGKDGVERRYVRRDGSVFHALTSVTKLGKGHGKFDALLQLTPIEARKERDEALAESEWRWNQALRSAEQGVWDIDVGNNRIWISPYWEGVLGFGSDKADAFRKKWLARLHPDDRAHMRHAIDGLRDGSLSETHETYRLQRADGVWVWILSRGKVTHRAPDGTALRIIGTTADITRQKDTEALLAATTERLDIALAAGGVGIYDVDVRTGLRNFDERTLALHGLQRASFDGTQNAWERALHPDDLARVLQQIATTRASQQSTTQYDYRVIHPSGAIRHVHAIARLIRAPDGAALRVIGVCRDVTEEARRTKQLEETLVQLAATTERLELALEAGGIGIFDVDIAADKRRFDDRILALHGLSREDYDGSREAWAQTIHPDDRARLIDQITADRASGSASQRYDFRVVYPKSDTIRHIRSITRQIHDADGAVQRVVGVSWDVTSEVEQTLRLQEAAARLATTTDRLNLALEAGDVGTFDTDVVAGRHMLDARTLTLLGREAGDAGHTVETWMGALHPEDRPRIEQEFAANLASTATSAQYDFRVVHKPSGAIRHIRSLTRLTRDGKGKALRATGACWDITDHVERARQLREALSLLDAIMNATPDLVFAKDLAGRYLITNKAAEKVTGHPVAAVVGKDDTEIYPPDVAAIYIANDRHALATGEPHTVEETSITGGVPRIWLTNKAPLRDAHGHVIGLVGVARDITEIKKAETALRETLELLDAVMRGTPDLIFVKDRDSRYLIANDALGQVLGRRTEEMLGLRPADVHPPHIAEQLMAHDRRIMASGAAQTIEETILVDDLPRIYLSTKAPRRDEHGNVIGVIGIARDITDMKTAEAAVRALNQHLQIAIEASGGGVFEADMTKPEFRWGERMYELYDLPRDAYDGTLEQWLSYIHADDVPKVLKAYEVAVNETSLFSMDFRIRRQRSGEMRHIRSFARVIRDDAGVAVRAVGMNFDITDHKELAEALFEEKERLRITLHSIGDSVITTDAEARITFMNPIAEQMTGWAAADAAGQPLREVFRIVDEITGAPFTDPVAACLAQMRPYHLDDGAVLIGRDGERRNVRDSAAPVRATSGDVIGAVLVFQDVTKARSLQQALEHSATHDGLTGLPNRTAFERSLRAAREATAKKRAHVLCFIDLDRFKVVNDSAGHAAGDALLRDVANLLRRACRADDVAARLGGDEFGLLLHDCAITDGEKLAQRFLKNLAELRFSWNDRAYQIGASIGLTLIATDAPPTDELMSQADIACYTAKFAGRNQIAVYGGAGSPAQKHHREVQVAAGIRNAIEGDRFRLFAQEVIDLKPADGAGRHFEILLRMLDERGAIMEPPSFIPASERYDLMGSIDRWVIRTTFRGYGARLRATPDMTISLNLSANSLNDPFLWPFLQEELEASGLPAGRINFEITETAVINNLAVAKQFLSRARAAGCGVLLDDFGTGLSSFIYLRQFPVDGVKIDGSFIRQMTENPIDRTIVESINAVGHRLGAVTVAEQVEDDATLDLVRAMGVDRAQGFAISRPAPFDNLF
jgi:diguanylate cyclase (GGDEF)-like protein/PAS domain S-box-containing protein